MAVPFIAALARFGASLSSGMGRMSAMAASTGARSAMSGASAAGRGASVAGASAGSGGARIGSSTLDKFIKGQEKLNKINSRANIDNIKYMNRFENSMVRIERIMQRMSKYSINIGSNFKLIAGIGAALSFSAISNSIRSHTPEQKFNAGVSRTSLAQQRALIKASEKYTRPNLLSNLDYRLGSIAVSALAMPGGDEQSLLQSLGINANYLKDNAGMSRINTLLTAYNRHKGNTEVIKMLSELLELTPAELDELYRNKEDINQTYMDRLNEVDNQTLENLTRFNQRLIEVDQQVESSYTRMTEALAPITTWLEELWGKIKMGFFDGITATINGLVAAFKKLGEWIEKLWKAIKEFYNWTIGLFKEEDKSGIREKNKKDIDESIARRFAELRSDNYTYHYSAGKSMMDAYKEMKPKIVEAFKKSGWSEWLGGNKDYNNWFKKQGEIIDELEEEYKNDPYTLGNKVVDSLADSYMKATEMLKETGEFDDDTIIRYASLVMAELMRKYLKNGLTPNKIGEIDEYMTEHEKEPEKIRELFVKIYSNNSDINSQPENIESTYR